MRKKVISSVLVFFSRLPLSATQRFGWFFGQLLYLFPNKQRDIARINIAICFPELSSSEKRQLLRSSLVASAQTMLELPGVWSGRYHCWVDRVVTGEGSERLDTALAEGKGVIVIGPHQGNWEVGLQHLSSLAKVTSPYRAPKLEFLDDLIKQGRGAGGATMVEATPGGVKALFGALRRGEIVAMLADQQPKAAGRHGSVFAPFFGHTALTMVLASRLAYKTGAPVLFQFMERLPGVAGYRMNWFAAPEGIYDADQVVAATALNRGLEQCIRHCPSQYLWSYKRFERQPDGMLSPYKLS